jgi:hypothetical protein
MMAQKHSSKSGKKFDKRHDRVVELGLVESNMTAISEADPAQDVAPMHAEPADTSLSTESESPEPATEKKGLSQREGVFQEVTRVLQEESIPHDPDVPVKPLLNEGAFKKIYSALIAGFQERRIYMKETENNRKKLEEPKLLEVYVVGLVNNWLKRDNRLNGKPKASS